MENKRNRTNRMMILRDDMKKLFELIGIIPQKITIREMPKLLTLLERFIKDDALYDYLENLDADCVQAIEEMKKRNLRDWNGKKMMDKLSALKQENQKLQDQVQLLIHEKETQQATANEHIAVEEKTSPSEIQAEVHKRHLAWIREIISLRDSILIRRSWIEENASENADAKRLVDTQLKDTRRLLEKMGVEIIDGSGRFDYRTHTAVGTVTTDSESLADCIAETVRPGYRYDGEMIRAQEVIVYTLTEEGS